MSMYHGPSSTDRLVQSIETCLQEWGDDPAYSKAVQSLREVKQELTNLSPGQQAARNAADYATAADRLQDVAREVQDLADPQQRAAGRAEGPNQTGQVP